jgi:hypothetical protein
MVPKYICIVGSLLGLSLVVGLLPSVRAVLIVTIHTPLGEVIRYRSIYIGYIDLLSLLHLRFHSLLIEAELGLRNLEQAGARNHRRLRSTLRERSFLIQTASVGLPWDHRPPFICLCRTLIIESSIIIII